MSASIFCIDCCGGSSSFARFAAAQSRSRTRWNAGADTCSTVSGPPCLGSLLYDRWLRTPKDSAAVVLDVTPRLLTRSSAVRLDYAVSGGRLMPRAPSAVELRPAMRESNVGRGVLACVHGRQRSP